jgi:hypothetical protein
MTTTKVRALRATCAAAVLLLGVSACGNGANATGRTGSTTGPRAGAQGEGFPQGQRAGFGMPGVVGKVAAVTGSTAQVQGFEGQVAVSWTASTAFTRQVGAALSEVKVGECVFVAAADPTASGSATSSATITASTVRITQPTNGSCTPAVRRPSGSTGTGDQSDGAPPSGAPRSGQRPPMRMGGAVGTVTAVSASGFTVASTSPGSGQQTSVAVTVDGSTTYTKTVAGAADDVKVGVCVQAEGTTDTTGAVTATRIAVSRPDNGQCGGFGRLRPSGATGQAS